MLIFHEAMHTGGGSFLGYNQTDNVTEAWEREAEYPSTISPRDDVIWTPDVIQRVTSLVVIMVIALFGNTIIIIVLTCSKYRKRNSRVNIFIINLAIGDLAVCFATMTTEILFVCFGEWLLGAAACRILPYLQIVTLASTTFILTAMSYDRFMAICRPLNFRNTGRQARLSIMAAWALAFVFAVPQLLIFVQTDDGVHPDGSTKHGCRSHGYTHQWQRKLYFTFLATYILVIPALFISYCYINVVLVVWRQGREIVGSSGALRRTLPDQRSIPRAKIKTIKMTLSIIATFSACWTPYFVVHLIRIYSNYNYKIPPAVMAFVETMALVQSGLNPLLYGFFNIKLKRGLVEVFCPNKLPKLNRNQSLKTTLLAESMPVTDEGNLISTSKRCREQNVPQINASERARAQAAIIKEENTNGVRLRVRFTSKEILHPSEKTGPPRDEESEEDTQKCETTDI